MNEELVKLIEAIVDKKLKSAKLDIKGITGAGGDTIISSMRNIFLQPGIGYTAKYKGVEIGSGGGTDHGALTGLSDDDHAQYLLLTAGSGRVLTGDLYINKTTPELHFEEGGATRGGLYVDASDNFIIAHAKVGGTEKLILGTVGTTGGSIDFEPRNAGVALSVSHTAITAAVGLVINPSITPTLYLQAGGVAQGYLQSSGGDLDLNSQVNGMLLGVPSAKTIALRVAGTPVLTIAGAAITAAVPLSMGVNKINQVPYIDSPDGVGLEFGYGSTTPVSKFKITSTVLEAYTSLDMGNYQITNLLAGSAAAHAVRYDQVLRLVGGTMAGSIAMGGYWITGLAAGAVAGDAIRYEQLIGVYHLLSGALGDITTPSMGAKDIYFTDGYGIDFRNDEVHKIAYIVASNALEIKSYQFINFKTTFDTGSPMSVGHDGIRLAEGLFFRKNQASDTVYIVDDATANMEFHVGAGKVFEFIVG